MSSPVKSDRAQSNISVKSAVMSGSFSYKASPLPSPVKSPSQILRPPSQISMMSAATSAASSAKHTLAVTATRVRAYATQVRTPPLSRHTAPYHTTSSHHIKPSHHFLPHHVTSCYISPTRPLDLSNPMDDQVTEQFDRVLDHAANAFIGSSLNHLNNSNSNINHHNSQKDPSIKSPSQTISSPSQISPSQMSPPPNQTDNKNTGERGEVLGIRACPDWVEDNREEEKNEETEDIGGGLRGLKGTGVHAINRASEYDSQSNRASEEYAQSYRASEYDSQSNRASEYDYDMASLPAHFVCVDMMVVPLTADEEESDDSQSNLTAPIQTAQSKVVPLTDVESDEGSLLIEPGPGFGFGRLGSGWLGLGPGLLTPGPGFGRIGQGRGVGLGTPSSSGSGSEIAIGLEQDRGLGFESGFRLGLESRTGLGSGGIGQGSKGLIERSQG